MSRAAPRQGQRPRVQSFAHEPHRELPVAQVRLVRWGEPPFAHRDGDELRSRPLDEKLDPLAVPDLGVPAVLAARLQGPLPVVLVEALADVGREVGADVRLDLLGPGAVAVGLREGPRPPVLDVPRRVREARGADLPDVRLLWSWSCSSIQEDPLAHLRAEDVVVLAASRLRQGLLVEFHRLRCGEAHLGHSC